MSHTLRILLLAIAAAAPLAAQEPAAQEPVPATPSPAAPQSAAAAPSPPDWQAIELGPERALSMEPIDLFGKQQAALTHLLLTRPEVQRATRSKSPTAAAQAPFRAILLPAGRPDLVVATATPAGQDGRWYLADLGPKPRMLARFTASILWVQPTDTNGLNDLVVLRFVRKLPTLAYLRFNGLDYKELDTRLVLPCPLIPGLFHPDLCLPNGRALQVPGQSAAPPPDLGRPSYAPIPPVSGRPEL